MASLDIENKYEILNKLAGVIHGTKICEGNCFEKILFEAIQKCGMFDVVENGKKIPLLINEHTIRGDRQSHKVDIFCKSVERREIYAYNSKGKSFNNTESNEIILLEYNKYKRSIETQYPGYSVEYAILKDEYKHNDPKMSKYHYLNANGIPVYNTHLYMKSKFNIITDDIELERKKKVLEILKERIISSGLSLDTIIEIFSSCNINSS